MTFTQEIIHSRLAYIASLNLDKSWLNRSAYALWSQFVAEKSGKHLQHIFQYPSPLEPFAHHFSKFSNLVHIPLLFPITLQSRPSTDELFVALVCADLSAHFQFTLEHIISSPHPTQKITSCTQSWRSLQDILDILANDALNTSLSELLKQLLTTYTQLFTWLAFGYIIDVKPKHFLDEGSRNCKELSARHHMFNCEIFFESLSLAHRHESYNNPKNGFNASFRKLIFSLVQHVANSKNQNETNVSTHDYKIIQDNLLWQNVLPVLYLGEISEMSFDRYCEPPSLYNYCQGYLKHTMTKLDGMALKSNIRVLVQGVKKSMLTFLDGMAYESDLKKQIDQLHAAELEESAQVYKNLPVKRLELGNLSALPNDLKSKKDVAKELSLNPSTIYRWHKKSLIENYGEQGSPFFSVEEVRNVSTNKKRGEKSL